MAVTSSVKARADELVKSVAETDWRNELLAFSSEVKEEGKTLSHKTQEIVDHLPEVVDNLPEQVWSTHQRNRSLPSSCTPLATDVRPRYHATMT